MPGCKLLTLFSSLGFLLLLSLNTKKPGDSNFLILFLSLFSVRVCMVLRQGMSKTRLEESQSGVQGDAARSWGCLRGYLNFFKRERGDNDGKNSKFLIE